MPSRSKTKPAAVKKTKAPSASKKSSAPQKKLSDLIETQKSASTRAGSTKVASKKPRAAKQTVDQTPATENGAGESRRAVYEHFEPVRKPEHAAVARRAREIWQNEGCPDGRAEEHWLRAERELSQLA